MFGRHAAAQATRVNKARGAYARAVATLTTFLHRTGTLWTRLAPSSFEPEGGMPGRKVPVRWRVATDETMRHVVRQGKVLAVPELAHSVHVEVEGLKAGREYFFQFEYRDDLSPVGHTRTAPSSKERVGSLAFAFASCQRWDEGYYSAYRRMAEEELAFVVHLGDYLYEYGIDANGGFRNVPVPDQFRPETTTLDRYRLQHALYKSAPTCRRRTGSSRGSSPHIKFFDGDRRGYVRCSVDRDEWRTDLRMVETVSRPESPIETFASFLVEDGHPGAVRV